MIKFLIVPVPVLALELGSANTGSFSTENWNNTSFERDLKASIWSSQGISTLWQKIWQTEEYRIALNFGGAKLW